MTHLALALSQPGFAFTTQGQHFGFCSSDLAVVHIRSSSLMLCGHRWNIEPSQEIPGHTSKIQMPCSSWKCSAVLGQSPKQKAQQGKGGIPTGAFQRELPFGFLSAESGSGSPETPQPRVWAALQQPGRLNPALYYPHET